jgi:hypothetical protein
MAAAVACCVRGAGILGRWNPGAGGRAKTCRLRLRTWRGGGVRWGVAAGQQEGRVEGAEAEDADGGDEVA